MVTTMTNSSDCQPLLELATPMLYRRNLFRILDMSVKDTPADVRRRQRRRKIMEETGMPESDDQGSYFALTPSPSEEENRVALDRLNDSQNRLIDEIFWLWPMGNSVTNDPALQMMAQGQIKQAIKIWTEQTGDNSQAATHNLAVLDHLIALDYEARLTAKDLGNNQKQQLADLLTSASKVWNRAFKRWRGVLKNDNFWSQVKNRVHEFNDPRLTTDFVLQIRDTLPKVLLLINARLAFSAVERGEEEIAAQHLRLVRESQFDKQLITEVLTESLAPLRHKIKALCDETELKVNADIKQTNEVISNFLERAKPLLKKVDLFLPQDNTLCQGMHDNVAETALQCEITYGNETKNWKESLKLVEATLPLAGSQSLRARLKDNLSIVRNNYEEDLCFFCQQEPPDSEANIEVDMYGDVNYHYDGRVTWSQLKVSVPRCNNCKRKHWYLEGLAMIVALLVLGSGTFVFPNLPFSIEISFFITFIFSVILMLITALSFGDVVCSILHIKPVGEQSKYNVIRKLKEEGWEYGTQPPEVNQE